MFSLRRSGLYVPSRDHGPGIRDQAGMCGEVWIELVDPDGTTHKHVYNTLGSAYKTLVAQLATAQAVVAPNWIALGTGALTQYAKTNQDTTIVLKSTGADQQIAQGFQASVVGTVDHVLLDLKRIGTSPGTLYVEIQTDAAGLPSGTIVTNGRSSTVSINGLPTSYDWMPFSFTTPPTLVAATQYHLVLKATGYTYSAAVTEVDLGADQSAPSYASGSTKTYNGTTWTAYSPASDLCFRICASSDITRTTLLDEIQRNILTTRTNTGAVARMLANYTTVQANDRIGEIGLFNVSSSGSPLAVATLNFNKTNQQAINAYWLVTFA